MPYDPSYPPTDAEIESAPLRAQFNGLKDLIDAIQTVGSATVDAVTTMPPGDPAAVSVSVTGSTLHFTFDIPQGATGGEGAPGPAGIDGNNGTNGSDGAQGEQGPPGEVTQAQFDAAINGTSSNSNTVDTLGMAVSDPPAQSEVQAIADKLDELILALRR